MSDDTGRRSSPWHLKLLALAAAAVVWVSGWVSAWWHYIGRYR